MLCSKAIETFLSCFLLILPQGLFAEAHQCCAFVAFVAAFLWCRQKARKPDACSLSGKIVISTNLWLSEQQCVLGKSLQYEMHTSLELMERWTVSVAWGKHGSAQRRSNQPWALYNYWPQRRKTQQINVHSTTPHYPSLFRDTKMDWIGMASETTLKDWTLRCL